VRPQRHTGGGVRRVQLHALGAALLAGIPDRERGAQVAGDVDAVGSWESGLIRSRAWKSAVRALPAILLLSWTTALAAQWPQWRGPGRDGIVQPSAVPAAWPEKLTLVLAAGAIVIRGANSLAAWSFR
jgi:hypothetical protein